MSFARATRTYKPAKSGRNEVFIEAKCKGHGRDRWSGVIEGHDLDGRLTYRDETARVWITC